MRFKCLTLLSSFILVLYCLGSEPLPEKLTYGLELCYKQNFDEAINFFEEIIETCPRSPWGYLSKAFVIEKKMQYFFNDELQDQFEVLIDEVIAKATAISENDVYRHLFKGLGLGLKSINLSRRKKNFQAYITSIKSMRELEVVLQKQPLLYDAYLFIGFFNYWSSFIPLHSDKRQLGISQLKTCSEKGIIFGKEAKFALLQIYKNEKDYKNAIEIGQELYSFYPSHIYLNWDMGTIYYSLGKWNEALNYLNIAWKEMILKRSYFNQEKYAAKKVALGYLIAKANFNNQSYLKCCEICDDLLRIIDSEKKLEKYKLEITKLQKEACGKIENAQHKESI